MTRETMAHWVTAIALAAVPVFAEAQTQTFTYTGAQQVFVVPAGVTTLTVEVSGASGWSGAYAGGDGGYATGQLAVTPGETLYVYVGGQGTVSIGDAIPSGGGFNGGGHGMTNTNPNSVGGGGGASDVRQGGFALADRVIVGAGGGGSTDNDGPAQAGGDGGGLVGADGAGNCCGGSIATGGTQSAGGSIGGAFGEGGDADPSMTPWIGGGGGGWYGGGVSDAHQSGAGGSSYIGGVTGGSTSTGVQTGNGEVTFTWTPALISEIPSLSNVGLLALLLLLAGVAAVRLAM